MVNLFVHWCWERGTSLPVFKALLALSPRSCLEAFFRPFLSCSRLGWCARAAEYLRLKNQPSFPIPFLVNSWSWNLLLEFFQICVGINSVPAGGKTCLRNRCGFFLPKSTFYLENSVWGPIWQQMNVFTCVDGLYVFRVQVSLKLIVCFWANKRSSVLL